MFAGIQKKTCPESAGQVFLFLVNLLNSKLVDTNRIIFLSRVEDNRRELRFIGAVGVVLGFQAESTPVGIYFTIFAGISAGQKITAVKLDTRFVGENFQGSAGHRLCHQGCQGQGSIVGCR